MSRLKRLINFFTEYYHARRDNGILYTNSRLGRFPIIVNKKYIKLIPLGYNSQAGQDSIAEYLLKKAYPEMLSLKIVDIGANHPVLINNTVYFEKMYLSNVENIEPNPFFCNLYLEANRSLHNCAIGISEQELELLIPQGGIVSDLGYSDNVHATFLRDELPFNGNEVKTMKCSVKPLVNVLECGHYNLLFIDVEGFEMSVLSGIDFNKFTFDIVFIENNSKNRRLDIIYNFMNDKGYILYGRIHNLDDIYVNRTMTSCLVV